ncbi:MAG: ABC transporter ATP-binding protein [Candidatus Thermoplasmatota archaeon]|nr:ABC transporter ATP-binding protein [Candidatus Thermoplasmatota archaeon]
MLTGRKLKEEKWLPPSNEIISFRNVDKVYKSGHTTNYALDSINFSIKTGKTLSVVGESGSGKTTFGLASLGLIEPTQGKIYFQGIDITSLDRIQKRNFRSKTHMIFQDPYSSLNPYNNIFTTVSAPIESFQKGMSKEERRNKAAEMLDKVGLSPGADFLDIYPKSLSGGQRQRVAIARSLINKPEFVVADEPTSMLDVSITSTVINLMKSLKDELNFTMLYISHEIATSRYIGDDMAVMNLGRIVEYGSPEEITKSPKHPYTDLLIRSYPKPGQKLVPGETRHGDYNVYNGGIKGCTFAYACPFKIPECENTKPELREISQGHWVACFHPIN